MFIYFARPIDQAGESSWLGSFAATIQHKLVLAKVGSFHPESAYIASPAYPEQAEYIDTLNNQALYLADALIAILPAGVPTLGTPVEISAALMFNKPTVIFTDTIASVQVAAWKRAGATVFDMNDLDFSVPESDDLRTLLTMEPNPDGDPIETTDETLFVKYGEGATPLRRTNPTDAGLDLATSRNWVLRPGYRTLIPTGVFGSVPDGWYGRITGRSSTLHRLEIQVHEGIIDAGYTGELMIGATFQGKGSLDLPAGSRLAQYILSPVWSGQVEQVDELPVTVRGENGWGSSGQ